jgi:hypothetical protein
MSLIPEIEITQFKKLKVEQIRQLKTVDLIADGQYLCTVVVPRTDYIKTQTQYMGELSNGVGGKDLMEVINAVQGSG